MVLNYDRFCFGCLGDVGREVKFEYGFFGVEDWLDVVKGVVGGENKCGDVV